MGDAVWVCRRSDIAAHWRGVHPTDGVPANERVDSSTSIMNTSQPAIQQSRRALVKSISPTERNGLSDAGSPVTTSSSRLLVTGGAGFVLSHVLSHWLSTDPTSTAVVFDRRQAWSHAVSVEGFLAQYVKEGRLVFFEGDVSSERSWDDLLRA